MMLGAILCIVSRSKANAASQPHSWPEGSLDLTACLEGIVTQQYSRISTTSLLCLWLEAWPPCLHSRRHCQTVVDLAFESMHCKFSASSMA